MCHTSLVTHYTLIETEYVKLFVMGCYTRTQMPDWLYKLKHTLMYKKDTRETHHKNEKGRTEDINTQMMIR